jgi:hypothetical protein
MGRMAISNRKIPPNQAVRSALAKARGDERASAPRAPPAPDEILPQYSLLLTAAGAMAYELLLSRLLAISGWQHFGFLVICIGLFGGMLGALLVALFGEGMAQRFERSYIALVTLFGLTGVGCFLGAQHIPFVLEEVLWDVRQPLLLAGVCALLAIPFFFAGAAVTLCLHQFRGEICRVFGISLTGAGIGVLLLIGLLYAFLPDTVLLIVGAIGVLCGALAWLEFGLQPRPGAAAFALLALGLLLIPSEWSALNISLQKSLPRALEVGGANLVTERSSPLGLLSVVENTLIPWSHAPGLSLNARHDPPEQVGVYTDADALTAITRPAKQPQEMDYLDFMTSAVPYQLRAMKRVLVVDAGGGAAVLQARFHNVPLIDALESNGQLARLVRDEFGTFSGGLFENPEVQLHIGDVRAFLGGTDARYDLIQIGQSDPIAAATAGRFAHSENYLYTVEAMRELLAHLETGGMIAFTRWVNLPPRDILKIFATVNTALERNGVLDGGAHMVLIRGWQTATLVVKNGPFTADDIVRVQNFCQVRGFDIGYYAGMQEEETSRHNVTDRAYFYLGAGSLAGDKRETYLSRYKFNLRPATDDRPYFHDFFRWQNLGDMLALRDKGGVVVLEWSYLVVFTTLIVLIVLVALFAVGPLLLSSRLLRLTPHNVRIGHIAGFFLATGLATTMLTMAIMQKYTLALHHPLVATAIVLSGLLIFAGAGSVFAQRFADVRQHRAFAWWAVLGLAAVTLLEINISGPVFGAAMEWPVAAQLLLALAMIAPIGLCLGVPATLALDQAGSDAAVLSPWAHALYVGAGVLGAPLALLLAMHIGQIAVTLVALALFAFAAWLLPPQGESF